MANTRALLTCGIAAGPFYVGLSLIQVFIREGFDVTRHPLSFLSIGELGWIQIANFLITGLLLILCAVGIRRALNGGKASTWGPLLLAVYGVSLMAAGMFVADPAFGFPPGTPEGPPAAISTHGILHFVAGGIGFMALIAACFVFARRFAASGDRGWTAYSIATGVVFFGAFGGIASGAGGAAANLIFGLAVLLTWSWLSALSARLRSTVAG